ncbi:MAG: hypothetical protein QXU73_06885 [Thermoplasmata archaeon]
MIAEPYREDDGEIGFAVIEKPENPRAYCKTLNELKDEDEGLYKDLNSLLASICWTSRGCGLPGKPDLNKDDPGLLRDIGLFISEHVEFPDPKYSILLASWVVCSWISELMDYAPRLVFYGPTRSGKSRALKVLKLLSYRSLDLLNPSGAALFRIIEQYRPTVLIDEYQALVGDRAGEVDLLFKGGYENGCKVPRARREGKEIDFFEIFSFLAIATKKLPAEDLQNRGVLIGMLEQSKGDIRRRMDYEEAFRLRTRLLAFRMRVLSGLIDLGPATDKARKAAEGAITVENNEVYLDDRGIDVASSLLVPCCYFGDNGEVLQLIAISQGKARMELLETFEAQTFFALQAVIRVKKRSSLDGSVNLGTLKVSTRDVADQLNQDYIAQGDADGSSRAIHTRRVTKALQVLGFSVKRGSRNQSYIVPSDFEVVYQANLKKYGSRSEEEAEE